MAHIAKLRCAAFALFEQQRVLVRLRLDRARGLANVGASGGIRGGVRLWRRGDLPRGRVSAKSRNA
jgi:hypothetical protein